MLNGILYQVVYTRKYCICQSVHPSQLAGSSLSNRGSEKPYIHGQGSLPGVTWHATAEALVSITTTHQTKWKQKQVKSRPGEPMELLRHVSKSIQTQAQLMQQTLHLALFLFSQSGGFSTSKTIL